ncbi:MAG: hypothetical protein J7J10_00265 [Deltaproteobacteria bacterium]|nr:hypothetical protein [Deltaproteobacteria bacterium]
MTSGDTLLYAVELFIVYLDNCRRQLQGKIPLVFFLDNKYKIYIFILMKMIFKVWWWAVKPARQ